MHSNMEKYQNDLGWRLYKRRGKCGISYRNIKSDNLRKRIIIVIILILLISFLAVLILLDYPPNQIVSSRAFPYVLAVFISIIFIIYYRDGILYINQKSGFLVINNRMPRWPCYLFKAEVDRESETGLYRVYLKPTEFLKIEGSSQNIEFLVWKSQTEEEAHRIADELRQYGIGATDVQDRHPIIKGNKIIVTIIVLSYLFCFIIFLFYVKRLFIPGILEGSEEAEAQALLKFIRAIISFGLFSIIPFAVYRLWYGLRVIKYRQIPPPRTIVLMDTIYFEGDRAVKKGRFIVMLASVLTMFGLIGGLILPYVLEKVFFEGILS